MTVQTMVSEQVEGVNSLMGKIRVIIADDHTIMRVGIKNILARSHDIQVVGEASNGAGSPGIN